MPTLYSGLGGLWDYTTSATMTTASNLQVDYTYSNCTPGTLVYPIIRMWQSANRQSKTYTVAADWGEWYIHENDAAALAGAGVTVEVRGQQLAQQDQVWASWNDEWIRVAPMYPQPEAPAVIQARAEREAALAKLRADALARAEELLFKFLTPQQRTEYERHGYFDVAVSDDRTYRLHRRSYMRNVELIGPDGKRRATYCAHPHDTSLPIPDVLLAQKFMLESNEREFLLLANRS